MSQKNHNYTCKKVLYYIFFWFLLLFVCKKIQIWKHRVIGIENHTKLQMIHYIYIHTITKLGIHVEKKKIERKKYDGKNEKWIDDTKNVLCVEMAFNDSADNNGKKIAIMKNDNSKLSVRWR